MIKKGHEHLRNVKYGYIKIKVIQENDFYFSIITFFIINLNPQIFILSDFPILIILGKSVKQEIKFII